MGNKRWTNEELDVVRKYYGKISLREISKLIDRSEDAIQNKGRQLGLRYEDKYSYDIDYFESIDTFDKAYWLGFLYADGCVSFNEEKRNYETCIKLKKDDYLHLKKFNKSINGNVQIKYKTVKPFVNKGYDKEYEECSIRLYSKRFAENLIKNGVVPNKTKMIEFPVLEDNLMWCFIRGFMDGDGHICLPNKTGYGYRVGFTCYNLDFLEKIQKFLDKYNIVSHINLDKKFGHTYKLEIRNKSSILIYLEKCYENDTMYLERKYNRYKLLYKLLRQ